MDYKDKQNRKDVGGKKSRDQAQQEDREQKPQSSQPDDHLGQQENNGSIDTENERLEQESLSNESNGIEDSGDSSDETLAHSRDFEKDEAEGGSTVGDAIGSSDDEAQQPDSSLEDYAEVGDTSSADAVPRRPDSDSSDRDKEKTEGEFYTYDESNPVETPGGEEKEETGSESLPYDETSRGDTPEDSAPGHAVENTYSSDETLAHSRDFKKDEEEGDSTAGDAPGFSDDEAQQPDSSLEDYAEVEDTSSADKRSLNEQFSVVAAQPTHKKLALVGIIALAGIALYFIFNMEGSTKEEKQQQEKQQRQKHVEKLAQDAEPVARSSGTPRLKVPKENSVSIPELPPLSAPKPPAPPPPPEPTAPPMPELPQQQNTTESSDTDTDNSNVNTTIAKRESSSLSINQGASAEERAKRRKANIIVFGGSGKGQSEGQPGGNSNQKTSTAIGFLGFGNGNSDDNEIEDTDVTQVKATKMSNLDRTIAQGKIIGAILETAINTDLPGTLRAIVTRDTYAENGREVLIPKGSRVVGAYSSDVSGGQTRVSITWNRIIRADGIDIAIDSMGSDRLGRAGVVGDLDNKLWPRLTNAFLVSYVIPITARKVSGVKNDDIATSTSTTADGTVTTNTTGSQKSQELQKSTERFSEIAKEVIENSFSTKPTITVNQGERINIFVQKDLIFPSKTALSKMKAAR